MLFLFYLPNTYAGTSIERGTLFSYLYVFFQHLHNMMPTPNIFLNINNNNYFVGQLDIPQTPS